MADVTTLKKQKKTHAQIERQLDEDKNAEKPVKLLLLGKFIFFPYGYGNSSNYLSFFGNTINIISYSVSGLGDSGKSTVLKQMRMLRGDGFSEEEKSTKRQNIHENMISGMVSLLHALNEEKPHNNLEVEFCSRKQNR